MQLKFNLKGTGNDFSNFLNEQIITQNANLQQLNEPIQNFDLALVGQGEMLRPMDPLDEDIYGCVLTEHTTDTLIRFCNNLPLPLTKVTLENLQFYEAIPGMEHGYYDSWEDEFLHCLSAKPLTFLKVKNCVLFPSPHASDGIGYSFSQLLECMDTLQTYIMENCSLESASLEYLTGFIKKNQWLTSISIINNEAIGCTSYTAKFVEACLRHNSLTKMNFFGCTLFYPLTKDFEGVFSDSKEENQAAVECFLTALKQNTIVQSLNLTDMVYGAHRDVFLPEPLVQNLADALKDNKTLTCLYLSHISKTGVKILANVLEQTSLTELHLSKSDCDDEYFNRVIQPLLLKNKHGETIKKIEGIKNLSNKVEGITILFDEILNLIDTYGKPALFFYQLFINEVLPYFPGRQNEILLQLCASAIQRRRPVEKARNVRYFFAEALAGSKQVENKRKYVLLFLRFDNSFENETAILRRRFFSPETMLLNSFEDYLEVDRIIFGEKLILSADCKGKRVAVYENIALAEEPQIFIFGSEEREEEIKTWIKNADVAEKEFLLQFEKINEEDIALVDMEEEPEELENTGKRQLDNDKEVSAAKRFFSNSNDKPDPSKTQLETSNGLGNK